MERPRAVFLPERHVGICETITKCDEVSDLLVLDTGALEDCHHAIHCGYYEGPHLRRGDVLVSSIAVSCPFIPDAPIVSSPARILLIVI